MFETVYVEEAIQGHPRAKAVLKRLAGATQVTCHHFGEVFNRKAQNFRLQKRRRALILAGKRGRLVLPAPAGYGLGSRRNFYFSHLLNCPYDCRYCFLQGLYRSAHLVLFVNYEDFFRALEEEIAEAGGGSEPPCFFSGYDCDSLALEPLTGFAAAFVPFFAARPRACLELRTKSVQVKGLLELEPARNCIAAFSFTPRPLHERHEEGVPSIPRRLEALVRLQERGWPVGLRFDPLLYLEGFEAVYRDFFAAVFDRVRAENLHSVSLGNFRLPRDIHWAMAGLYPEEKLFAFGLEEREGLVSYREAVVARLLDFCQEEISKYVPEEKVFRC
ncbi:MAG: DNA photolyase [Planctomycetes bacterium]|nr:DNA photolyase [Planctomycetota bacterium]